ncbi:MAG TPA: DUF2490 domain-containing protein [Leadbetterella sp.]|nr:DUF2490 domain-containing protein [Leadbetterella sp.]
MKYALKILFVVIIGSTVGHGQQPDSVVVGNQLWIGNYTKIRFSNHWGLWLEPHLRRTDNFTNKPFQTLARMGAIYFLDDASQLLAGYTFSNFGSEYQRFNGVENEQRIWQQFQSASYLSRRFKLSHWVRLEECFMNQVAESKFEMRANGNVNFSVDLAYWKKQKGIVSVVVYDNFFLYFKNAKVGQDIFDQNRFFVGLAYPSNKKSYLQIGYLLVNQLNRNEVYTINHNIGIYWFKNINNIKR